MPCDKEFFYILLSTPTELIPWKDIFFNMGKTTMHTVLENGNFDEVGFESVNLPQNANVGIGSLLFVPVRFLVGLRYCAERRCAVSVRR